MKSKRRKSIIAATLCMVMMLSTGISAIAEAEPVVEEPAIVAEQENIQTDSQSVETAETKEEETAPVQEEKTTETVQQQKTTETVQEQTKVAQEDAKVEEGVQNTPETVKSDASESPETKQAAEVQEQKKETENITKDTVAGPSKLTYENKELGVQVTVLAMGENAIPSGASLKVVPILEDDVQTVQQYKEVSSKIQEKAKKDGEEIRGFLAYDISLVDVSGAEIEPNGEVKVTIDYDKATLPEELDSESSKEVEMNVLHLKEDSNGKINDVIDMRSADKIEQLKTTEVNQVETVSVKTDSFSPYVITWTYSSENVKITFKIEPECYDENNTKFTNLDGSKGINGSGKKSLQDLAPSIEGYTVSRAEIDSEEFKFLRIQYRDKKYQLEYSLDGSNWNGTGYFCKNGENTTVSVKFYYEKVFKPTFYYVYVSPKEGGGYETDLLWKGEGFPKAGNSMGLQESDSTSQDEIRRRYGFGSGDHSLSKVQNLKDTVIDNVSDTINNTYNKVEFVGARLYSQGSFGQENNYNFSGIHEDATYITYLKEVDGGFQYSTESSATNYQTVKDQDIVFLFSDVIDRSVLSATEAGKNGLVVDLSDKLKGDQDVSVEIGKSAEWENYAERIAEITFELSGTPKIDPLDIILVIDSSYSMDFSNYDWDYQSCSTDVSAQTFGGYARYARFFDGQDAPNKLTGTSRMDATKYAAYSVAATFLKNNQDIEDNSQKNRIAVVDFNETVTADSAFSAEYDNVTRRIENIKTNTGTHTGGAIEAAKTLAESSKNANRNCITIVLSDGAPNKAYQNFDTTLSALKDVSSVYTIGVDLSEDIITDEKKIGIPGTGQTQKAFFNSIASTSSQAYNANSYSGDGGDGTNVIQECFNSIIADLTTVAENAVIHDIISQYFDYDSPPVSEGNISNTDKNVEITVGDISALSRTYQFQVKIGDNYKDKVASYLTNQNNPANDDDVYVSYDVGQETGSTPVTDDPEVPVYYEAKVEYYYYDENGNECAINLNGNPYIQQFIDGKVFEEKGSETYASYGMLTINTEAPSFELTEKIRDAGLSVASYLEGYHFEEVKTGLTLTTGTENKYNLFIDNTSNVIKVYYAKDYPWQIVKKSSSDNGNGPVLQGAEFSLTLDDIPATQYTGVSDENGVVQWKQGDTLIESTDFPKGTYTLRETKAPEGYSKSGKIWTITISNKGSKPIIACNGGSISGSADANGIYEFTYLNDAVYSLPSSGGPGIFWYTIGGVLLMMAGTLILYKSKNREVLKR